MAKKTLHRSSKTGQIVTEEFAEKHPATTQKETIKETISPCSASFGQEDLNKLVDKINEIILHLNKVL